MRPNAETQPAGEMAALIAAFDWESTPLGAATHWPTELKTVVGTLLGANHAMLLWWGPQLIQIYNDAYRDVIGPERHPSGLGQSGRECWEEIWPVIGMQIESIMAGGPATWHEDQLIPFTRFGQREDAWWTYGYSPIPGPDGVAGVLNIASDVTDAHQAKQQMLRLNERLVEEALRRRHEADRLKVLFEQAPGFMCILRGREHVVEFANRAYLRLVGQRNVLGRRISDVIPEAVEQGFIATLDRVYETGQPFAAHEQSILLQLDPESSRLTERVLDFVYQPIVEADGAVSGIFVEGSDVTAKTQAQAELHESQDRLAKGMVAARMTVWDWSLATGKVEFSANAREIFGADFEDLARPWSWLDTDEATIIENACTRAIADRDRFHAVVRARHRISGETMWIDIRGTVLTDGHGEPFAIRGVTLDVTDRKRAEVELQTADRRKDEFLAMLAHELRNPLAPISAAAQLLRMPGMDGERMRAASDIIGRQVKHMTSLVDDLLDVSRVSRGQVQLDMQPVDIKRLLSEAIEQVGPLIEAHRHRLDIEQSPETLLAIGDRKRLVQVIANLLNNAAKYTPSGGRLSVALDATPETVELTVADNGIGIEPDLLPRVFDLFTQAERAMDRSQGGLGIGLSLVRGIAELHGGRVTASSAGPGTGSTFVVSLPRYLDREPAEKRSSPVGDATPPVRPLRILIVDDNLDAAYSLSLVLDAAGHRTLVEQHPLKALELIESGPFDAGLLDIGLPGMDGNELARRIRALPIEPQPVLIAITGYGQDGNRKISMEAGFDHYFVKPVDAGDLIRLLSDITASVTAGPGTTRSPTTGHRD